MKHISYSFFLLVLVWLCLPGLASGQSCQKSISMARPLIQTWQKHQELPLKEQYLKTREEWKGKISSQSLANHPQYLGKEKKEGGQLWGQSQRHYMTLPLASDGANVFFVLTSGKGKVGIRICQVNQQGLATNMKAVVLNEETGSEGKKFSFEAVKGEILVVSLKNYGARGVLSYRLSIE